MHPELDKVFMLLNKYHEWNPKCRFRFSTNGLGPKVEKALKAIPSWVAVRNSAKTHREQKFTAYNSAPVDHGERRVVCCSVPWRCGIALTRYGYFLCGAGASVARVFGKDIGLKHFDEVTPEELLQQRNSLCKFCGHSQVKSRHIVTKQEISPSWEKAIASYKDRNLQLY